MRFYIFSLQTSLSIAFRIVIEKKNTVNMSSKYQNTLNSIMSYLRVLLDIRNITQSEIDWERNKKHDIFIIK